RKREGGWRSGDRDGDDGVDRGDDSDADLFVIIFEPSCAGAVNYVPALIYILHIGPEDTQKGIRHIDRKRSRVVCCLAREHNRRWVVGHAWPGSLAVENEIAL